MSGEDNNDMARLKPHGYEIYRLHRYAHLINDPFYTDEKVVAAIMSDGALLFCRHVRLKATAHNPEGVWRNLGWRYSLNGNKVRWAKEAEQPYTITPDMMMEGLKRMSFTLVRKNGHKVEEDAPKRVKVA
jgi:hypothetical protein